MINHKLFSSIVFIFIPFNFIMFSYHSYEKDGWNYRLFKSLTRVIVVKGMLRLSFFPIVILFFSKLNHCGLWSVKPWVSFNGSCFLLPHLNAEWLTMFNDGKWENKNVVNYKYFTVSRSKHFRGVNILF